MKTNQPSSKSLLSRWMEGLKEYNRKRKERLASVDFGVPFTVHHITHPLGPRD